MLWNGGMLGLGFASLDGTLALASLAWIAVGCVAAWALEESTGFWQSVFED